ncbi:hypothetical protein HQ533_05040 [Candidatus Woesearchaeota archaeon]|nr:hypothetical protein [Candidatus Woesearchaeota archaeon]
MEVSEKVFNNHLKLIPKVKECQEANTNLFKEFIFSSRDIMVPWLLTCMLTDDLIINYSKKIKVPYTEILNSTPMIETPMITEHKESLKIKKLLEEKGLLDLIRKDYDKALEEIKKDKIIWDKIEKHLEEFDWVGFHHFWGETLTLDKFLKELHKVEELHSKKNKPSENTRFITKAASELAYIRQKSAEIFSKVSFKANNFLTLIAKKLGLTYKELLLLTFREAINHLENNTKPNIKNRERDDFCLFLHNDKEILINNPEELSKLRKSLMPKEDLSDKEIKGIPACEGKAKGIVKIFSVPENMDKMNEGDVLVSPMTTPDFIPMMKKASAIVTDVGGLLSHPAIVSREMNIPCIVGTKIATKILKDGDLVEVDANKGVVRKIE